MRIAGMLAFLLVTWAPACQSQAASQPVPGAAKPCTISLPYLPEHGVGCAPRSAAAYDFAFCSVHYALASLTLPDGRASSEAELREQYRQTGILYALISEALTDIDMFRRNTTLARDYYQSLSSDAAARRFSLDHVNARCNEVDHHHADVLKGLSDEVKVRIRRKE